MGCVSTLLAQQYIYIYINTTQEFLYSLSKQNSIPPKKLFQNSVLNKLQAFHFCSTNNVTETD